jgi:diadenosine tetraphosphate (Ap4A) HIT family hydrolase
VKAIGEARNARMVTMTTADCFVCTKHRERGAMLPGGPVGEDRFVVVSHMPAAPSRHGVGSAYLGHLFVEPWRHAPGMDDLTEDEARSVGLWCARASRALREVARAEHVYAAVIGDAVPHLHVHLTARYPGTPRDYWWQRVEEWRGAPRGDEAAVVDFVARLRTYLDALSEANGRDR